MLKADSTSMLAALCLMYSEENDASFAAWACIEKDIMADTGLEEQENAVILERPSKDGNGNIRIHIRSSKPLTDWSFPALSKKLSDGLQLEFKSSTISPGTTAPEHEHNIHAHITGNESSIELLPYPSQSHSSDDGIAARHLAESTAADASVSGPSAEPQNAEECQRTFAFTFINLGGDVFVQARRNFTSLSLWKIWTVHASRPLVWLSSCPQCLPMELFT